MTTPKHFNWMPLWVGDYLRDTTELDVTESGAYLHLIMHYWTHGGLPDDARKLCQICKMTTRQGTKILPVLKPFFHDGWKHKRIDFELAKAREIHDHASKRASLAATIRWAKAHAPRDAPSMPEAMLEQCLTNAPSPSPKQKSNSSFGTARAKRANNGAEAMINPDDEAKHTARQKRALTDMEKRNREAIVREWRSLGREPMTDGHGGLISVALAKSLGRFSLPDDATHGKEKKTNR